VSKAGAISVRWQYWRTRKELRIERHWSEASHRLDANLYLRRAITAR
jgi:hypothetical protein